jgi:glycosyltransferase involved in cell wall biosynthesis
MKIAILGTRGIPANYSGFETSVQETAIRLAARGHTVTVYCRSNYIKYVDKEFQGVRLVKLPSIQQKFADTPIHTTLSALHIWRALPDIIQLYGVGNSLWLPLLKMTGRPIVSVVDGLDWQRAKWHGFARWFLRQSENWAVNWSNAYVVDSQTVVQYYQQRFHKAPVYIAYGANVPENTPATNWLEHYGLTPNRYILFVGRLVPEKGVQYLIKAFEHVPTNMNLVIVGDNIHDPQFVNELKSTRDPRILFLGFVYGEGYQQLNSHAYLYVQPSDLEGTSPALLGAMGFGNCVLVSDIPENLETIGDAGVSFRRSNMDDLAIKLLHLIEHPDEVHRFKEKAQRRVSNIYSWDKITDDYENLFLKLLEQ